MVWFWVLVSGEDRTWAVAIFIFLKIVLDELLGLRRITETSSFVGRHTDGIIPMLSFSSLESKFSISSGACESEYARALIMHCDSGGKRTLFLAITNTVNGEP